MEHPLILEKIGNLPTEWLAEDKPFRLPSLRVIAVTSGKGGVGKSNLAANLGVALTRLGRQVLLIDADLGLANLDIILGLTPKSTIQDVLSLRTTITAALVEGPGGLKILPASSGIPELADLDEYQKAFLLEELDSYSERLNFVLIDTGAGISRNVLFFNLAALERIVVVNKEPTSLTDAYALIKILATRHQERHFHLVVNGVDRPREAEVVYRNVLKVIERFLGREITLDYLGCIPLDDAVPKAVLKRQAVLDLYPQSRASRAIAALARRLEASPPPQGNRGNVKFFWRRLLHQNREEI